MTKPHPLMSEYDHMAARRPCALRPGGAREHIYQMTDDRLDLGEGEGTRERYGRYPDRRSETRA